MFQPIITKRPTQTMRIMNMKKGSNQFSEISQINNDLQQIAHRDNDVKSSIQNLKKKLNIHGGFDDLDFSQSSISIAENCGCCNMLRKKLQQMRTRSHSIKQEMKIMGLQNAKISKQSKRLQGKIKELEEQIQKKQKQSHNEVEKQNKFLVDYKMKDMQCAALLKQNKTLVSTIQSNKVQIAQLRRQSQTYISIKHESSNRQNSELQSTIQMYIRMIKQKDEQYERQKQKYSEYLQKQQNQYKQIQQSHLQLQNSLKNQLEEKQKVIQLINRSVNNDSISQTNFFNQKIKDKETQVNGLVNEVDALKHELIEINNDNVYLKQIIGNYEVQLMQQSQKIDQYEAKVNNSIVKQKNEFMKQFQSLKSQVELSNKSEDQYRSKVQELQSFYNNQLNVNEGLTNNLKQIKSQKVGLVQQNQILFQQNSQMLSDLRNIQYQHEILQKEQQKLINQNREAMQQLKQSSIQLNQKQNRIYFLQNSIERAENDYRMTIKQLEQDIESKTRNVNDCNQIIQKYQSNQNQEVFRLKREITKLIQQISSQQKQIQRQKQTNLRVNSDLLGMKSSLERRNLEFSEKVRDVEGLQKKYGQALEQKKNISQQLVSEKQLTKTLAKELNLLKTQKMGFEQQRKVFDHQKQVYENQIQLLKTSFKSHSQDKRKQFEQYSRFESLNQQMINLKNKSLTLEGVNHELSRQIEQKNSQITSASKTIEINYKRIQQLANQLQVVQTQLQRQRSKLSQDQLESDVKQFELKMKISSLEEEVLKVNAISQKVKSSYSLLQQQYKKLEFSQKDELSPGKMSNNQQRSKRLSRKNELDDRQFKRLNSQIKKLSEEKQKIASQLIEKSEKFDLLMFQCNQLQDKFKQETSSLNEQLQGMNQTIILLENQIGVMSNDNVNLFHDNKKMFSQNIKLTDHCAKLQLELESTKQTLKQILSQQALIKEKPPSPSKLRFQSKQSSGKQINLNLPSSAQKKSEAMSITISQLTQQISKLTTENNELRPLINENIKLKSQLNKKEQQIAQISNNQLHYQVQSESLNMMINSILGQKTALQNQKNNLKQAMKKLQNDNSIINQKNNKLQVEIQNLSNKLESTLKQSQEAQRLYSLEIHNSNEEKNKFTVQMESNQRDLSLESEKIKHNQKQLQLKQTQIFNKQIQLKQQALFLHEKQNKMQEKQQAMQTKRSLLEQLEEKLKDRFKQIQEKALLLDGKQYKFQENENAMEDTLINAKKMLELIERKSKTIEKIKLKKKLRQQQLSEKAAKTYENSRQAKKPQKSIQNKVQSLNLNRSIQQYNKKEQKQKIQQEQDLPTVMEINKEDDSQKDLENNFVHLQNKISNFLKTSKQMKQSRNTEREKSQIDTLHQNLKDHQQLMELIAHIQQPSKHPAISQFKELQFLYFTQIQAFILTKYQQVKDLSNRPLKEAALLLSQIFQSNKLLLSMRLQSEVKKLTEQIKISIQRLFNNLKLLGQYDLKVQPLPLLGKRMQKSESYPHLQRNESMQFKKNKSPVIGTKTKHTYSQMYSDRKPQQKFQEFQEYQKSQSAKNWQAVAYDENNEEPLQQLSNKKKQKSILLIEDIGQAISVEQQQKQKKSLNRLGEFSLHNSSGNSGSIKIQKNQKLPSKELEKSFEFKVENQLNSSDKKDDSVQYYSESPGLMLSQQSSMSRKQMQQRYKTNIKNSKLSKKLKSKKKKQ